MGVGVGCNQNFGDKFRDLYHQVIMDRSEDLWWNGVTFKNIILIISLILH